MAKASKHKFKDIRKKLKADVATSIENVLKKLSASSHATARKLAKGAAAKVAKDFVKKLKKDDKADRASSKTKPSRRAKPAARQASASKKAVAAKKPVSTKTRRKPVVKKAPLKKVELPSEVLETSSQNS